MVVKTRLVYKLWDSCRGKKKDLDATAYWTCFWLHQKTTCDWPLIITIHIHSNLLNTKFFIKLCLLHLCKHISVSSIKPLLAISFNHLFMRPAQYVNVTGVQATAGHHSLSLLESPICLNLDVSGLWDKTQRLGLTVSPVSHHTSSLIWIKYRWDQATMSIYRARTVVNVGLILNYIPGWHWS